MSSRNLSRTSHERPSGRWQTPRHGHHMMSPWMSCDVTRAGKGLIPKTIYTSLDKTIRRLTFVCQCVSTCEK